MKPITSCAAAAALAAGLAVSGCATKRYPIATELSQAEAGMLTCRELDIELVRADQVRAQISDTGQVDWRSAAGFLGDWGIGNAMARSEAESALNRRVNTIRAAQAAKGCLGREAQAQDQIDRAMEQAAEAAD